jgi:hypothetical protein
MKKVINPFASLCILFALSTFGTACTKWHTYPVYGDKQILAKRPIGDPHMVETSNSNLGANFLGASQESGNTTVNGGTMSGNVNSTKTSMCMQTHEVDYLQTYEMRPILLGRYLDIGLGAISSIMGLSYFNVVKSEYDWDLDRYEDQDCDDFNGCFWDEPSFPLVPYIIGGSLIAAGPGVIAYSFLKLPKASKPEVVTKEKRFSYRESLEVQGCK